MKALPAQPSLYQINTGVSLGAVRDGEGALPFARHLVDVREEERYAHAEYPLRGALRTL